MAQPAKSSFDILEVDGLPRRAQPETGRLVEFIPLPALVVASDKTVIEANTGAAGLLGYKPSELAGKALTDIIRFAGAPEGSDLFDKGSEGLESELLKTDSTTIPAQLFVSSLGDGTWLVIANDISEKRQALDALYAERRSFQSQKSEALERLAGGIAHDFNNYLAVILLQTDMLNLQLGEDSPLQHRVNEIRAASNDAAGIVRQLLAFGRKQPMTPVPVVLNRVIQDAAGFLKALVGNNISVEINVEQGLGVCYVDQNQISQALMYLAVNAKDAMPGGGTLTIATSNAEIVRNGIQPGGPYIQITVSDNGCGMDAKTEDHVFEPFFSTKGTDKGAGLSLATVYGIVKQSGGFIWVKSEKSRGTSFTLQFPRVDQPSASNAAASITPQGEKTARKTILLIDDDRSVRNVTAEILRLADYDVLEAPDGKQGIEIARLSERPIDLILTDFVMPGIDGYDTAESIQTLHPAAAVLFMSGNIALLKPDDKGKFLSKPFSSAVLKKKVSEMLERKLG